MLLSWFRSCDFARDLQCIVLEACVPFDLIVPRGLNQQGICFMVVTLRAYSQENYIEQGKRVYSATELYYM